MAPVNDEYDENDENEQRKSVGEWMMETTLNYFLQSHSTNKFL